MILIKKLIFDSYSTQGCQGSIGPAVHGSRFQTEPWYTVQNWNRDCLEMSQFRLRILESRNCRPVPVWTAKNIFLFYCIFQKPSILRFRSRTGSSNSNIFFIYNFFPINTPHPTHFLTTSSLNPEHSSLILKSLKSQSQSLSILKFILSFLSSRLSNSSCSKKKINSQTHSSLIFILFTTLILL